MHLSTAHISQPVQMFLKCSLRLSENIWFFFLSLRSSLCPAPNEGRGKYAHAVTVFFCFYCFFLLLFLIFLKNLKLWQQTNKNGLSIQLLDHRLDLKRGGGGAMNPAVLDCVGLSSTLNKDDWNHCAGVTYCFGYFCTCLIVYVNLTVVWLFNMSWNCREAAQWTPRVFHIFGSCL